MDIRFINLTPFIPLSLQGEGEGKIKEGYRPLKLPTWEKEDNMAVKGCPIKFQMKCRHCPLSFQDRMSKCNWYRNLRERWYKRIDTKGWHSDFFRLST